MRMRRCPCSQNNQQTDELLRLSDLRKGDYGVIIQNQSSGDLKRRFLDLGLIRGMRFSVIRKAPLGDPIELKMNGFLLSLRKEEADHILVKKIG
jgi:Fe2+ transport system protein FeoA